MAEVEDTDGKQGEAVVFGRQTVRDGKLLVVAAQKVEAAQELWIKPLRLAGFATRIVPIPSCINLFCKRSAPAFCADAFFVLHLIRINNFRIDEKNSKSKSSTIRRVYRC